ncbi:YbaB/EbfC family nucleoid-associated protein [Marmoricola sp. RAF53]|uniref:YbaB/EbfC family nucleoid-associated protein n=1 Tax=Marmoricola sp. RAF53 TaxID=3233059 RepID=UPI003F9A3C2F
MTDTPMNPFGDGGLDLGAMLEQAQQMQVQLMQAQDELAAQSVSGSAGGITVTVTGVGEMTSVRVPVGTFDGSDADSVADLGDLVVAAYRDAKAKADALAATTLGPMAGGLGLGG